MSAPAASKLDPFRDAIVAMLHEDPNVAATVIAERLRPQGFAASPTILKDHLRQVRPASVTAASYQRTSYLPGELARGRLVAHRPSGADWQGPYARGVRAGGDAARLGSAAGGVHVGRGTAEYCAALLGCLERLGGCRGRWCPTTTPGSSPAAWWAGPAGRRGRRPVWRTGLRPRSCDPGSRRARGRLSGRSVNWRPRFCPCARLATRPTCGPQADTWTLQVADQRHARRLGARVADALAVERAALRRLPERWPDVDRPPGGPGQPRRVRASGRGRPLGSATAGRPALGMRLALTEVVVFCVGGEVTRHARSWVPADVALAPAHARQLPLTCEATSRLAANDVQVQVADPVARGQDTGRPRLQLQRSVLTASRSSCTWPSSTSC
jgi:hypothetical protein